MCTRLFGDMCPEIALDYLLHIDLSGKPLAIFSGLPKAGTSLGPGDCRGTPLAM